MRNLLKLICRMGIVVLLFTALSGCTADTPNEISEAYAYSTEIRSFLRPAVANGEALRTALTTDTEDGTFFCFTKEEAEANDFINTQRTLVQYLRSCGIRIEELEYYGTDYGYSFSQSSENAIYVGFSDVRTWQQVLVTLQGVWGDYTDYGYVYALSNAIADELGWQADAIPAFEKKDADLFFAENPGAVQLLYPTFTEKLASQETVTHSKALAAHLLEGINWEDAVSKPISEQLDAYYDLIRAYAQELSIPFELQACGYAYYGENVKLRIITAYAELIIDRNYHDVHETVYGDYWGDYLSVYQTTNTINAEISAAVEYFDLQDTAGIIQLNWLDKNDSNTQWLIRNNGAYYYSTHTAYVTSAVSYLHEYYHHIQYLLNPDLKFAWQSQTFCELGAFYSLYRQMSMKNMFTQDEEGVKLFYDYTGRSYEPGRDDYYEVMDILCYDSEYYKLEYQTGGEAHNSFCRYLVDLYGEESVFDVLLFPNTVEDATGKTWDSLRAEWEQYIREKFEHIQPAQ